MSNEKKKMWGPERPTFTMEAPATYPIFNSITNNPTIGDERYFVKIGEINPQSTNLSDSVVVTAGKKYLVYIYFHNNASSTFNDSEHNHVGVALGTRLMTEFSDVVTPENEGVLVASIISENSNPSSVWCSVIMKSITGDVHLKYVENSARLLCDWAANKSLLSSSMFSDDGVLLGLDELNGVIPGCEEYHGVVTFILQAE